MTMSSEALDLSYARRWLETVSEASERGEIVFEMELNDGRYLVAEEWPSRVAWSSMRAIARRLRRCSR
jgi:hypothetical protein